MMGCQCKYEYLPERRSGIDRRSLLNYVPKEAERRTGVDRRKANNVWRGNSHL